MLCLALQWLDMVCRRSRSCWSVPYACSHRITHRTRNRNLLFIDHVNQATLSLYLSLNTNTMASSSSSSVPAANAGRDEQLLAVGRQCSHPSCGLVDFLPFKCQHCADSFCADHFKPASHSCPKYDEAKYNRIVPDCEHRACYSFCQ
jgi:hypothetical protein